jgi:hypothetical protein
MTAVLPPSVAAAAIGFTLSSEAASTSATGGTRRGEPDQASQRKKPKAIGTIHMKLTNESYVILMGTRNFTERYYRDKDGWLKVSARGRKFRMTAEQVLNHLLPALAGVKSNLMLKVEHQAAAGAAKRG